MMLSVFLGLRLKAVIRLCVLTLHCAECEHVNGLLPSVSPEAHVPLQLNRVRHSCYWKVMCGDGWTKHEARSVRLRFMKDDQHCDFWVFA